MKEKFVELVKSFYPNETFIPLHRPIFEGNERKDLVNCIDSNFVSSVGKEVAIFEKKISTFTSTNYGISTVNGTSALHIALKVVGVRNEDEVITQAVTFVATCNALAYLGAVPIFVDVDLDTLGMSPEALSKFLHSNAEKRNDGAWNKTTGRRISACVPMHTYGFPCRIEEISVICNDWGIELIEDAAEALGSTISGKKISSFGSIGVFSFNGNKIITTGGGGMLVTNNELYAKRALHLTTTAKVPHHYEFIHDEIGYNYRMPNLNAALGCAQMENLETMLLSKKVIADTYEEFFNKLSIDMIKPLTNYTANNWLNTILLKNKNERDEFIAFTNSNGVMTRPMWRLMSKLEMFKNSQSDGLINSLWLEDRLVNLPSSVPFS